MEVLEACKLESGWENDVAQPPAIYNSFLTREWKAQQTQASAVTDSASREKSAKATMGERVERLQERRVFFSWKTFSVLYYIQWSPKIHLRVSEALNI